MTEAAAPTANAGRAMIAPANDVLLNAIASITPMMVKLMSVDTTRMMRTASVIGMPAPTSDL